jgi:NADPH-dependent curcumin reductase CurA
MTEIKNQRVVFLQRPGAEGVNESLFRVEDTPMPPALEDGQALLGSYLFSLDPTIHNALRAEEAAMTDQAGKSGYWDFMRWKLGETPMWMLIGVVKQSKNDALPEGAFVRAFAPWQVFNVITQGEVLKCSDSLLPENHMSALGMTGKTAALPLLKCDA